MRSRKAGHLEPFTRVTLLLARSHDWWIITQAEAIDSYLNLRDDLEHTAQAAAVVELLDRFIYEDGQNYQLFQLLIDTMERINSMENPFAALRYYEIHLLDLLGYRPELANCTACGSEIVAQDQYFSCEMGGVLCPRCPGRSTDARPVSLEALKYLRHFQRSAFQQAGAASFRPTILAEVEILLQHYLNYLLERSLNATNFMRSIKK